MKSLLENANCGRKHTSKEILALNSANQQGQGIVAAALFTDRTGIAAAGNLFED